MAEELQKKSVIFAFSQKRCWSFPKDVRKTVWHRSCLKFCPEVCEEKNIYPFDGWQGELSSPHDYPRGIRRGLSLEVTMLVSNRMTKDPVTTAPADLLIQAQLKMQKGGYRRLPVVADGRLVGIVTELDMRAHAGYLDRTEVKAAMSEKPITVTPVTTVEAAAQLLLKQKIGGLPVVENGRLVGIITTSDVLQAFLDVTGASEVTSSRIDFVIEEEGHGLAEASRAIAQEGGEVLGVGTYRKTWGDATVCYLRLRLGDAGAIAKVLKEKGFEVLGVHPLVG